LAVTFGNQQNFMPLFFLIDNSIPEFDGPFIFYMLSRCLARCIHGVFCLLNS
jgi:hypothetical protein